LYAPRKLEVVVGVFRSNPQSGFASHKLETVDKAGKSAHTILPDVIDHGWIAQAVLRSGGECRFAPQSGLSFRASIAAHIFPLPLSLRRALDSYMMRVAALLTPASSLGEILGQYRMHGENLTAVTKYTEQSANRNAMDYWLVFDELKRFVDRFYGPRIAELLRSEDSPIYQQYALIKHLFSQTDSGQLVGFALHNLPMRRRLLWRSLLALPRAVGQGLFNFRSALRAPRVRAWASAIFQRTEAI